MGMTDSQQAIIAAIGSPAKQDKVMARYKKLGYVKDARDEEGLHMSFSPYVVPKGLTAKQIRRRINKYFREKDKPLMLRNLVGHRFTILMDGKFFAGISVKSNVTKNNRTWTAFIKDYLKTLKAPKKKG